MKNTSLNGGGAEATNILPYSDPDSLIQEDDVSEAGKGIKES